MTTERLLAELVNIINALGPDDQEVVNFINANSSDSEFVELGRLSCNLKRALIKKGKVGPSLIVEYTNLLHKHGGPNSNEAKAFVALHIKNDIFVKRAEILHKLWLFKK